MNRPILAFALFAVASAALAAQQASQSSPYEGTSNPPADDTIVTTTTPQSKPPAGQPLNAQPAAPAPVPAQSQAEPQPGSAGPPANYPTDGSDDGLVQGLPATPAQPGQPALNERAYASEPDGDIVHPLPLRPGELGEGTTIRVRLLGRLSSVTSEKGEAFRTRVSSDVVQGGQVVIPAGTEIDGRVVKVSSGHVGGHGFIRLQPEMVILPGGARYRLHAEVSGTPGSRTRVGGEGAIDPGSRVRRDEIEYGGAVGAGVVTGAIVGGPVGALAGGLIGAGAITTHLLISHPQATLEPGTAILFTLTEPLYLVQAGANGN
jgi:hypothetical protein